MKRYIVSCIVLAGLTFVTGQVNDGSLADKFNRIEKLGGSVNTYTFAKGEYDALEKVPDFILSGNAQGHIQGIAEKDNYIYFSHDELSPKDAANHIGSGWLFVMDKNKNEIVNAYEFSNDIDNNNHPGGIGIYENYLLLPITKHGSETQIGSSKTLILDISNPLDIKEIVSFNHAAGTASMAKVNGRYVVLLSDGWIDSGNDVYRQQFYISDSDVINSKTKFTAATYNFHTKYGTHIPNAGMYENGATLLGYDNELYIAGFNDNSNTVDLFTFEKTDLLTVNRLRHNDITKIGTYNMKLPGDPNYSIGSGLFSSGSNASIDENGRLSIVATESSFNTNGTRFIQYRSPVMLNSLRILLQD